MRIKIKSKDKRQWSNYNPFLPVICEGHIVWREEIERKWNPEGGVLVIIDPYDSGEMSGEWEYRFKKY